MAGSQFQSRLKRGFAARGQKKSRYSLGGFAFFLGTDHSTLSQILRDKRPIPARQVRQWGRKLGMMPEEIAAYVAEQYVPDLSAARRGEQLRHWTAEAMAILSERSHWLILHVLHSSEFKPDCRWIARRIGTSVDTVNVSLSRLLRLKLLGMGRTGKWKDVANCGVGTEAEFQKKALIRVRELAADDGVALLRIRNTFPK